MEKRKLKRNKVQTERNPKARTQMSNNMSVPEERGNCGKLGHYAKFCRSKRKIYHRADEGTYSADEDDWTPDRIRSILQKVNSMGTTSKNGPPFYTKTVFVNEQPIKFIVGTGSPVIMISKTKLNYITAIKPVTEEYRAVNDNKMKFEGKETAIIERYKEATGFINNNTSTTHTTHTRLDKKAGHHPKKRQNNKIFNHINKPDQPSCRPDRQIATLRSKFHKCFTENHTVKNVEVDIQLKEGQT